MSVVRRNVLANFVGKFWAVLVSLAAVPFLLRLLGIEAFGIVGVYMVLVATLTVLDFGMGTTLNRSLAEWSVAKASTRQMGDLARTMEAAALVVALLVGAVLLSLAPVIAQKWVVARALTQTELRDALTLMAIAVAAQWPLALYSAGLAGLQRQVAANVIATVMATIRNFGVIAVLYVWKPTLEAFFVWYIAVNLIETIAVRTLFWRAIPRAAEASRVRPAMLFEQWRFSAGVGGIAVLAVILTQLDKLILSKLLPLQEFGYYTLAWRVASGLFYLVSPIMAAFFPRFTQLATLEARDELARLYHSGCQLTAVAVIPVTVLIAVFPQTLLLLWTQDARAAQECAPLLALLAVGTAINGLMNLPLALQLAFGWTRLVFSLNAVAVLLLGPLTYVFAVRHGAEGAAWVWILLNCGYVFFMLQSMHRRLLPGQLSVWFIHDVGRPLAASLLVALPARLLSSTDGSSMRMLAEVSLAAGAMICASAWATPRVRDFARAGLHRFLRRGPTR